MKDNVSFILGKKIKAVLINENIHGGTASQVFLIFEDDSTQEFWSNSAIQAARHREENRGLEWAKFYAAGAEGKITIYE